MKFENSYQMRFDASRFRWLFRLLNARCQSQLFASVFSLQKMAVQVNVIYFPRVSTDLTIIYIIIYYIYYYLLMIVFLLVLGKKQVVIKITKFPDLEISLQISPTSKLQWPFTWETSLALTFRRSSRWIYLLYDYLLAKKILPIANLQHLLWRFISANPKITQCLIFFRMFPGISAVECGWCTLCCCSSFQQ